MQFPDISPVLCCLGPICIRWYALMYIFGFIATYLLVLRQIRQFNFTALKKQFENLNSLLILSVIVGGRLGYVLFYNLRYYCEHPGEIVATWNGGMSFHGACFTLIFVGWLFCRLKKIDFWKSADLYIVTIPIGLGLGRIGNFINGELFGRITTAPTGMVFPAGGPFPRHPSQLYEALLEGVLLFLILWSLRRRPWQQRRNWPHGTMLALFLICYGLFRIVVENFREPDAQLGFLFLHITMGQLLSAVMVTGGVLLWYLRKRICSAAADPRPQSAGG